MIGRMEYTIERFMWSYQAHFRMAAEFAAEGVAKQLGLELEPEVFLVGLRVEEPAAVVHPACVEPEDHHWADSASMDHLAEEIEAEVKRDPAAEMFISHPVGTRRYAEGLRAAAVRRLILGHLEACDHRPPGRRILVSGAVRRDDHWICMVLTVDERVWEAVPSIEMTGREDHRGSVYHVPASLAEAAVRELFAEVSRALTMPDAGSDLHFLDAYNELLRRAGARFFFGLISRGGFGQRGDTRQFAALDGLSLAAYEKQEARGRIVLLGPLAAASDDAWAPPLSIRFREPLSIHNLRGLRKVLSLTNDSTAAVCTPDGVIGTASGVGSAEPVAGRPVLACFEGRAAWSVHAEGRELMRIEDGRPGLPARPLEPVDFAFELRRRVPGLGQQHADALASVATTLAGADHGAVLVVTPDAAAEAGRLQATSLPIEPVTLTEPLALTFAGIDGATLCDARMQVHAIGVILDGLATEKGDPARGARLNATLRYVESSPGRRCAMVVSEDGGIELLPKLKPAVHPEERRAALAELARLADDDPERHARKDELAAIERVRRCAHTLEDDHCAAANRDLASIESRFYKDAEFKITTPPWRVDPSFAPERDLREDAPRTTQD